MMKASELGHHIIGKQNRLDFSEPKLILKRTDDFELREKILAIPYSKARELGLGKGTLHYMKHNARSDKPFKVYSSTRKKIFL